MKAEEAQEKGRQGVMWARHQLWQIFGEDTIDLPFNSYDHIKKLSFVDINSGSDFSFDLGGNLRRPNPTRFAKNEVVEVFVEVKCYDTSADLLNHYKEFLRRAATVSLQPRHSDTWFIFFATAPFGCTYGVKLCNGELFSECQTSWPQPLHECSKNLYERIIIIISTSSFQRLLKQWGRESER